MHRSGLQALGAFLAVSLLAALSPLAKLEPSSPIALALAGARGGDGAIALYASAVILTLAGPLVAVAAPTRPALSSPSIHSTRPSAPPVAVLLFTR